MTLTVITIPDNTADWPGWLDAQLVGCSLMDLVDELRLVTDSEPAEPLLAIVTPQQLLEVLGSGTSVFSIEQFRCLFGNPAGLLQLQEQILENGSAYWDRLGRSEKSVLQSNRVFEAVMQRAPSTMPSANTSASFSQRRRGWFLGATAVAVALLAVMLWQSDPGSDATWGLSDPALLSSNAETAEDWFRAVAVAGEQWSGRDLSDQKQLLSSISDVSIACQQLIDNPSRVLSPAEKSWFVMKCQNWKTKLDVTAADIQDGKLTLEAGRSQSTAIMAKLVAVLKAGPSDADLEALSV